MPNTLILMSWNVQWGRGADGRVDWQRQLAVVQAVSPDVLCLQELPQHFSELPGSQGEDALAWWQQALPDYEWGYAPGYDRRRPDGVRSRFGNAIASRWPMPFFRTLSLPMPPATTRKYLPRTAAEAIVALPWGLEVRVLATHLEYYCSRQRWAQVQALIAQGRWEDGIVPEVAFCLLTDPLAGGTSEPALTVPPVDASHRSVATLDRSAVDVEPLRVAESDSDDDAVLFTPPPRPSAQVLMGDLNFAPSSPEYTALAQSGVWHDAWRCVWGDLPHAHTVGLHGAEWPDHPYCCDYAWVSAALAPHVRAYQVLADTPASDHQPIVLTLEWR